MDLPRLLRSPFRRPPPDTDRAFADWLGSEAGQAMLEEQRCLLADILVRAVGYHALQCSVGSGEPLLAVGRAGIQLEPLFPLAPSDNASLLARMLAVQMADGHVRLSQQMLGGSPLGEYDLQFFPVLRDHILAGKELTLIISDTGATTQTRDSYSGDGIEATARHFAQAIRNARPEMPRSELIDLLAKNLHIGPTRVYDRQPDDPAAKSWLWRNDAGEALEPANHAKVMIIDELGYVPLSPSGVS